MPVTDDTPHPPPDHPSLRPRRRHALFSLRWRLTLLFGLGSAAVLAAVFITLNHFLVSTLLADTDNQLRSHAEDVAASAAAPGVLNDPALVRSLVRNGTVSGLVSNPALVLVRDTRGNVLASSSDVAVDELAPTRSQMVQLRQGKTTFRTLKTDTSKHVRLVSVPVMIDGVYAGLVQAGESQERSLEAGDRLQALLMGEGAAGLVLAAAVGYFFVRRGLLPLQRVGLVAADIEANDLTRRIGMRRQTIEVQTLADTFDAMLERLEGSFQQQRSFVLDVSHELRTPLTALRGNIDVLLMDPELPAGVRAQLERMSAETSRLIRLAANLLLLGQADTGKLGVMAPVELDLLCLEVVQQARSLKPSVRLRLGDEDQVTVLGDRDLLKQLLLNLVENGLTYTPPGGRVTLSLSREADHAAIEVRDSGVGIAPDDLPHVFERFYRVESSRRRATGGAGVGLAIVDWVARLHGGAVSVASEPGKGSSFTVRLPLRGAPAGPPAAVPAAANAAAAPEPAPAAPARG